MSFFKNKRFFILSLAIFLAGLAALGVWAACTFLPVKPAKTPNPVTEPAKTTTTTSPTLPQNPIDFDTLQARNSDIYAWIKVPGTLVDHAVVQSGDGLKEDYYLRRDLDKKYDINGSIYTQRLNLKDFSDANTVLYGHNMLDDKTMFSSLIRFRKKEFFDENRYIYVYTPGHILTYTIYAAYRYDNRHILYSFDCNDPDVFAEYLKITKNPKSTIKNIREDVEVTVEDRIITLSTCITNDNYRYLVQGVLTDDQPTQ